MSITLAANSSMICLYWKIGKAILEKQEVEGWGTKVIDRMSKDLCDEFPDMKGFSARNIKYMRKFALSWDDFITCLNGEPIGFVTWDPRNRPDYVEIGHNGIREKYKGNGYGHRQLTEALNRIKSYTGLKRIIVCTNSNLVAPKNYESVGFKLYDRKVNVTESFYTGDYLYYEIIL